jgi:hypothetical protein
MSFSISNQNNRGENDRKYAHSCFGQWEQPEGPGAVQIVIDFVYWKSTILSSNLQWGIPRNNSGGRHSWRRLRRRASCGWSAIPGFLQKRWAYEEPDKILRSHESQGDSKCCQISASQRCGRVLAEYIKRSLNLSTHKFQKNWDCVSMPAMTTHKFWSISQPCHIIYQLYSRDMFINNWNAKM